MTQCFERWLAGAIKRDNLAIDDRGLCSDETGNFLELRKALREIAAIA
jgi:hypothetical protein